MESGEDQNVGCKKIARNRIIWMGGEGRNKRTIK
jgi:hypothetical protein